MWLVILLVFAVAFWVVLHHQEQTTAKAPRGGGGPVTVTTVTAQKGDIGSYLDAIGTVTPVYTSSITSQVNGIVTAVYYKEGQIVHKGDPLIDIDSRSYRATLMQAQGTLERDEKCFGDGEDGPAALPRSVGSQSHTKATAGRSGKNRAAKSG